MRSAPVGRLDPQPAGGEGAGEDQRPGVLGDVDEAAGTGEPAAEPADIDVARAVGLRHAEAGEVEPAAVVEVELLVLGDDGARVDGGAEVEPALRQAADDPGLGGERHLLEQVLLLGHRGHGLGHADAEIDHAAHRQLHGTAAGDDLALVQGQGRDAVERHPQLAREGGLKAVA